MSERKGGDVVGGDAAGDGATARYFYRAVYLARDEWLSVDGVRTEQLNAGCQLAGSDQSWSQSESGKRAGWLPRGVKPDW